MSQSRFISHVMEQSRRRDVLEFGSFVVTVRSTFPWLGIVAVVEKST